MSLIINADYIRNTPKQLLMSFGCSAEQLYYDDLPYHPYVTDDFEQQGLFRVRRDKSLPFKTIQHNPDGLIRCLVFDIDKDQASHHWYDCNAPAPNWVIINPKNGHAHYVYMLDCPVPTTDAARLKPQKYAAAVERALSLKLDADINYVGLVSKNPLSEHWRAWKPRVEAYSLAELEEYVDLSTLPKLKKREHDGTSRHCILFDELRYWAYARVLQAREDMTLAQWIKTLLHKAEALNTFHNQLPFNSLHHTAKSVGRWTWSHYTGSGGKVKRGRDATQNSQLELHDKQVLAAYKTNQQRKSTSEDKIKAAVKQLSEQGKRVSIRSVAKLSGVAKSTVERHWKKHQIGIIRCTSDNQKSVLVRCTSDNQKSVLVRCTSDNHVVAGK